MPEEFWALDHGEYAVAQNIVAGYEDGNYHPEYGVTRDQMAVYICRAFDPPASLVPLGCVTSPDASRAR